MKKDILNNEFPAPPEKPFFTNRTISIIGVCVLILIAALTWYISILQTNVNILKAEAKQVEIVKKVETIKKQQAEVIKDLKTSSQSNADQGNKLINTLPNEKIFVSDTTFDAMREYIQNYRPNQ